MTDYPELDPSEHLALLSARARRRLEEAPPLVHYVRLRRQPGGAAPDGQPRAASKTPPAPLHIGALDDADQVFVDLTGYVRHWAKALSIAAMPNTIGTVWAVDGVMLGFRPVVTPPGAAWLVNRLTTWLLLHHDRIATQAGGPAYFDDVAGLIERVYSRFPTDARPERPHLKRPCPVCGKFAVTCDWQADADVRDVTVWCQQCSHVLVSTTGDGEVSQREYRRVVKQIAAGSTVPRLEGVNA